MQRLLLSLRTKPEPELESFPYTQDQLGSINGFRVDQLMAIVFHCCDSVCTDNPTHTSACAPPWCNADVYTHVLDGILFYEKKGTRNQFRFIKQQYKLQTYLYEEHRAV